MNCIDTIQTKSGPLKIHCPNETSRLRSKRALIREVETIEWINSFSKGDVFWDIGSNIGVFSLYAAKVPEATVVSFEILPWNCAALENNLTLNELHDKVSVFGFGVSDKVETIPVNIPEQASMFGGAGGQIKRTVDTHGRPFKPMYTMNALGYTMDELTKIPGIPFPTHIKMDIDGNEDKAIAGAEKTLSDPRLKSLMFELELEGRDAVLEIISKHNFTLVKACSSVTGEAFDSTKNGGNHFFIRSPK